MAHFDNAGVDGVVPAVPAGLRRWHAAVGTYREEYAYIDVFESYLHQRSILSVAYAVVPHLASRLAELDPDRAAAIVDHISLVEETRLVPQEEVEAAVRELAAMPGEVYADMAQTMRHRHPVLPADLAAAYLQAVDAATAHAGDGWNQLLSDEPGPHHVRRHIRYLREAGLDDGSIQAGVDALRDGDVAALYLGLPEALRAVQQAALAWPNDAPATVDDLGFLALHSLACVPQFRLPH